MAAVLVIQTIGGGGGAGGMVISSGVPVSAQTYNVFVGAGGVSNPQNELVVDAYFGNGSAPCLQLEVSLDWWWRWNHKE